MKVHLQSSRLLSMALFAISIYSTPAIIGADYRSVVVSDTDGGQVSFRLTTTLRFGLTSEALTVRDKDLEIDINRDHLAGFHFSDEEADIESTGTNLRPMPTIGDEGITFSALPDQYIEIYSPDGILRDRIKASAPHFISYTSLASGINIFRYGGLSFKIMAK